MFYSYTRFLLKGMNKAETIVKVVMSPHEPPKLFVEDYLKVRAQLPPPLPFACAPVPRRWNMLAL